MWISYTDTQEGGHRYRIQTTHPQVPGQKKEVYSKVRVERNMLVERVEM